MRRLCLALLVLGPWACDEDEPAQPVDFGLPPAMDATTPDLGAPDLSPPDMGPMLCDVLGTSLGEGLAPAARDDTAYAYDADCGRLFVFFGDQSVPQVCNFQSAQFVNEAYVFDTRRNSWSQLNLPTGGPNPADRAGAVWDAQRQRVVLFGGRWRAGSRGAYTYSNEVWSFDPAANTWAQLHDGMNAPEGRMDFLMLSDPERDRFIISHGGQFTPDFTSFVVYADTWAFDLANNQWSRIAQNGATPEALVYPAGAIDDQRDQLWVFSGSGRDAFTQPARSEQWVLDLGTDTWTELAFSATGPGARFNSAMVWDAPRDRMVLFGGHDNTDLGNNNDLWSLDLTSREWTLLREGDTFNRPPRGRCDFPGDFATADLSSPERRAAHIFAVGEPGTAVLYGGNTDCGIANDTWALDLSTDAWSQLTISPVGMTCPRSGNPNCSAATASMCD